MDKKYSLKQGGEPVTGITSSTWFDIVNEKNQIIRELTNSRLPIVKLPEAAPQKNNFQTLLREVGNIYDVAYKAFINIFRVINHRENGVLLSTGSAKTAKTASGMTYNEHTLDFSGIMQFDRTFVPTGTTQPAELRWNEEDGTFDMGMGFDAVVQQVGMEQYYPPVTNKTGDDFIEGTIVMVDPTQTVQGQRFRIIKAIGDGSLPTKLILGMLTMDINDNATGLVTKFGYVRDLSISDLQDGLLKDPLETWAEGEELYLSPTLNGGMTNVEPQAPNLKIPCAIITRLTGDNLTVFVRFEGTFKLSDIHDVETYIASGITEGSTLTWDATNKYWKVSDDPDYYKMVITTGSTYTPTGQSNSVIEIDSILPTTITLPTGYTNGYHVKFTNLNNIITTFLAGTGAEIRSRNDELQMPFQYSVVDAYYNNNKWLINGDLGGDLEAFVPMDGLKTWLDGADASTITLNGTDVAIWGDRSGVGTNYEQANAARQPYYDVDKQAVYFADYEYLELGANSEYLSNIHTTFLVVEPTDSLVNNRTIIRHSYNTSTTLTGIITTSNQVAFHARNAANSYIGSGVLNSNSGYALSNKSLIWATWRANDNLDMDVDDYPMVTVTGATNSPTSHSRTRIGVDSANTLSQYFYGYVYEVLFYTRELTEQEIIGVKNYLKNKWNI